MHYFPSLSLSLSPLILAKLIVKSAMAARTSYYFAYKTPTIDIMRIDERWTLVCMQSSPPLFVLHEYMWYYITSPPPWSEIEVYLAIHIHVYMYVYVRYRYIEVELFETKGQLLSKLVWKRDWIRNCTPLVTKMCVYIYSMIDPLFFDKTPMLEASVRIKQFDNHFISGELIVHALLSMSH